MRNLRRLGRAGLILLMLTLIILSFLPAWETDRWWVRQWDFPRLQIAGLLILASIGLLFVQAGRWRWALLGAGGAALVWQLTHFIAYFPPYPKQVASAENCPAGRQISLLNANVLMTNRNFGGLLELVRQNEPDVLLLLEPGLEWETAVEPLRSRYPFVLSEPLPNTYGMILMSRLPMKGAIRHLLQPGVPSAKVVVRLRGGQQVALHALHPEPPLPFDDSGERDAELVTVGRSVRDEGRAAIVIGDLNDVAWSRTSSLFREVAGMNDSRVGRGFYPTFNANYPLLQWPLDHLFVSPHFELIGIERLPNFGSDHFPMMFRLCLKADASTRRVSPSAPPEAEAEASEEVGAGVAERQEEQNGR